MQFEETIAKMLLSFPKAPLWAIWIVGALMTITGWSLGMSMAVVGIIALDTLTGLWRAYTLQNITSVGFRRGGDKIIGYMVMAILATLLALIGLEIEQTTLIDIPEWVFLITPNAVGVWIFWNELVSILENLDQMGVHLPEIIRKGLKVYSQTDS